MPYYGRSRETLDALVDGLEVGVMDLARQIDRALPPVGGSKKGFFKDLSEDRDPPWQSRGWAYLVAQDCLECTGSGLPKTLRKLKFFNCPRVRPEILMSADREMPGLSTLMVQNCPLFNQIIHLDLFAAQPHLVHVSLGTTVVRPSRAEALKDPAISAASPSSSLSSLPPLPPVDAPRPIDHALPPA